MRLGHFGHPSTLLYLHDLVSDVQRYFRQLSGEPQRQNPFLLHQCQKHWEIAALSGLEEPRHTPVLFEQCTPDVKVGSASR